MEKIKNLRVDIAFGGPTCQTDQFMAWLQEVCEVFNLEIAGLIPVGVAGAWPEVRFRGKEEDVREFARSFFDGDGDEILDEFGWDDEEEFNGPYIDPRFTTKGNRVYIDESTKQFI
jgi:hypothetical protein